MDGWMNCCAWWISTAAGALLLSISRACLLPFRHSVHAIFPGEKTNSDRALPCLYSAHNGVGALAQKLSRTVELFPLPSAKSFNKPFFQARCSPVGRPSSSSRLSFSARSNNKFLMTIERGAKLEVSLSITSCWYELLRNPCCCDAVPLMLLRTHWPIICKAIIANSNRISYNAVQSTGQRGECACMVLGDAGLGMEIYIWQQHGILFGNLYQLMLLLVQGRRAICLNWVVCSYTPPLIFHFESASFFRMCVINAPAVPEEIDCAGSWKFLWRANAIKTRFKNLKQPLCAKTSCFAESNRHSSLCLFHSRILLRAPWIQMTRYTKRTDPSGMEHVTLRREFPAAAVSSHSTRLHMCTALKLRCR